jgi:hypothetical protein
MADFGYDVSDHTAVDPVFGDLRAVDRLLIAAYRRRLRVLLDWVPNHTSSIHPWFLESRSSRDSSSATGMSGGTVQATSRRTTGVLRSVGLLGPGTTPRGSGISTSSSLSNPTSTGPTERSSRRCTACSVSGSIVASTAFAPTSFI